MLWKRATNAGGFLAVQQYTSHMTGMVSAMADAVALGQEHDAYEWLTPAAAHKRFTWPRESEALRHIQRLLTGGDAGVVEDVLRIP